MDGFQGSIEVGGLSNEDPNWREGIPGDIPLESILRLWFLLFLLPGCHKASISAPPFLLYFALSQAQYNVTGGSWTTPLNP